MKTLLALILLGLPLVAQHTYKVSQKDQVAILVAEAAQAKADNNLIGLQVRAQQLIEAAQARFQQASEKLRAAQETARRDAKAPASAALAPDAGSFKEPKKPGK